MLEVMNLNTFIRRLVLGQLAGLAFTVLADSPAMAGFDATTNNVGSTAAGLETPVNQKVTPVGTLVELPHVRPNALALSPDGKILVTAGLTQELLVVDPVTGKIFQRVHFPTDEWPKPY